LGNSRALSHGADAMGKEDLVSNMPDEFRLSIIVPLYRSPELIRPLVDSLINVAGEIKNENGIVIFINDSPEDTELKTVLAYQLEKSEVIFPYNILENPKNLGFIKSVNRGLERAIENGCDVLLLNSDALLTKGTINELKRAAYSDSMIGFVSPRSNNATICNSPYPDRFRHLSMLDAHKAHLGIEKYLDAVTYTPTVVGFCMYIKSRIIRDFGMLSEIYGHGYNEENDLIFRCNRAGYRAALANRAYVHHEGSVSFDNTGKGRNQREIENRAKLDERFPEYARSITRYFDSVEYMSQYLLASLLPAENGCINIKFDCENIGSYYNGTFEHALLLISNFARNYGDKYNIYISCNAAAAEFHKIGHIDHTCMILPDAELKVGFAVIFRIGQPFSWHEMINMIRSAPLTGYLMLDTIALDCMSLDEVGLQEIWANMLNMASFVVFNSEFSRDQFIRRFGYRYNKGYSTALLSTNLDEYVLEAESDSDRKVPIIEPGYVLIIGNHYAHKNLEATLSEIKKYSIFPRVVVIGQEIVGEDRVIGFKSGDLKQCVIDSFYKNAALVLFPSHYEGFGIPILRALSAKVPVIARNIPVFVEIKGKSRSGCNIHLLDCTEQIVSFAATIPKWIAVEDKFAIEHGWADSASSLNDAIQETMRQFSLDDLKRRLEIADLGGKWLSAVPNVAQISSHSIVDDPWDSKLKSHFSREYKALASSLRGHITPVKPNDHAEVSLLPLNKIPDAVSNTLKFKNLKLPDRVIYKDRKSFLFLLIDLAAVLSDSGSLGLSVTTQRRKFIFLKREPIAFEGLAAMTSNVGLVIKSFRQDGDTIHLQLYKDFDWADKILTDGSDAEFVSNIYRALLMRQADPGSQVWLNDLKNGLDRFALVKRILASDERMSLIAIGMHRP
jgi:GT2 family glycosyltransferase